MCLSETKSGIAIKLLELLNYSFLGHLILDPCKGPIKKGLSILLPFCPSFHPTLLSLLSSYASVPPFICAGIISLNCIIHFLDFGTVLETHMKFCQKYSENGPKIEKELFINFCWVWSNENLSYLLFSCTNPIFGKISVPEIWAEMFSANQIAGFFNQLYLQNK